ncbi:MAG: SpoIIE family protein phosphatase [Coriobacteriia bacterium]|nr:SpoIIE family protein phosphatase [Coriobacteriia bacterium]
MRDDDSTSLGSVSGSEVPEVGDGCAMPPELDTLLQDLTDILAELTGFSAVGISLIERPDVAKFHAVHGWPRELVGREYDLLAAHFPDYNAFCGGEPLIRDISDPTMDAEYRAQFIALGAPRTLAVPISRDGHLLGTVACTHLGETHDFTEHEIGVARAIAAQAAVVVENARLVEAEHAAREESEAESHRIATLYQLGPAATSSLDLHEVSRRVIEQIRALPDAACGGLYMLDREREVLKNLAAFGFPEETHPWFEELPLDQTSVPATVAVRDLDILTDEGFTLPAMAKRLEAMGLLDSRWVALAIRAGSQLLGVLAITFRGSRPHSEEELRLYRGIAASMAQPLANAQLYRQLAASNDRVNDILNSIADGFVAVDRNWRYLVVNPTAERMLHRSADYLIGRSMAEEFPEADGWPFYQQVMETRQPVVFESYARMVPSWVEVHAFPTREGISMIVSDITARKLAERELAKANQRLDAHVGNSPIAIVEFDRDFVITRFSEEAERLFGWVAEEVLGKPMIDFPWIYEDDVELVARESARLMSGEVSRSVNVNRNVRKDGAVRWCEWYSSAIYDEEGELISVFSQVLDITERRDRERFGELLNEIASAVGSTLEQDVILERLYARASHAVHGDAAALILRVGNEWKLTDSYGVDADTVRTLFEEGAIPPPPTDRSRFAPIVYQDVAGAERIARVAELGLKRLLIVPLLSGGEMVGVLEFGQLTSGPEFSEAEIDFATRLMPIVTVALDNARLFEREHRIASTLQQAVIAAPKPIEGVETACLYVPASTSENVGGDFYDVFELPDDRIAVTIGDVSGKGLGAAQLTSLVRDGIRAYALDRPEPAWVLDHVNQLLCRSVELGMFATVFLAILDPDNDRLAYADGGHPPAILFNTEKAEFLDEARSPLVGGFPRAEYTQAEVDFCPGDKLLLYTDGLTEARCDGVLFGDDRLIGTLSKLRGVPVADIPQALLDSAMAFADGRLADDTAIVCVRRSD